jgi:hypothetical protein
MKSSPFAVGPGIKCPYIGSLWFSSVSDNVLAHAPPETGVQI